MTTSKSAYLEYLQEVKLRNLGVPSEIMSNIRQYYQSLNLISSDEYSKYLLDWLQGKTKLTTKYEEPTFYYLLKKYSSRIEDGISNRKVSMIEPKVDLNQLKQNGQFPLFGSWFTNEINATTIRMENSQDYLVVFHSQLFIFCNLISKIIAMITSNVKSDKHHDAKKEYIYNDCSAVIDNVESRLVENPAITDHLVDLISSFLDFGNIGMVSQYNPENWYKTNADLYTETLELFALGHEYAHIVCGHLEDSSIISSFVNPEEKINESIYNHDSEYEADFNGLNFMFGTVSTDKVLLPYTLCGPTIFFHFEHILKQSKSILDTEIERSPKRESSHPPPLDRLNRLRYEINKVWGQSPWEASLLAPSFMIDKVVEALLNKLIDKLDDLHDDNENR